MGDGGFWHNGLLTGVQSALFNGDDAVLLIFKNGYTSATGTQDITQHARRRDEGATPATSAEPGAHQPDHREHAQGPGRAMAARRQHLRRGRRCARTLTEAFTSDFNGLKVIVAEGECQLERQRRIKPWIAGLLEARRARGAREVRRRRGRLHRRPRLHPPVGLPDADAEGQPRSAEGGPGGHGDRRLRGLRPVRRERARGHAVPVASTAPRWCSNPRWHERLAARCAAPWCGCCSPHDGPPRTLPTAPEPTT